MTNKTTPRHVFFISDRTGITAENLGHALLTQFSSISFEHHSLPFTDTEKKARLAAKTIDQFAQTSQQQPLVFSTLIDDSYRKIIAHTQAHMIDFFDTFIKPLEIELSTASSHAQGLSHGISNEIVYMSRMEAINFALKNDDGTNTKAYENADIILIGVSRCGKTPTCLYMALHYGVKAGNYPLTESDLEAQKLPDALRHHKAKIVGLMIDADRLAQIRETRRPGSRYSSLKQCYREVDAAESLLRSAGVPIFHTTHSSIEEIASRVLLQLGLQREMF